MKAASNPRFIPHEATGERIALSRSWERLCSGEMAEPLIYVDVSDVHEGLLGDLKEAITGLAEFIEENEPQLLSYNAYFSDDGTHMSVVHVHADPASLDRHLEIAGPRFARFAELVTLRSIQLRMG